MRRSLLVLTLLVAAACGDNKNRTTPDGGTDPGEPVITDPPPTEVACATLPATTDNAVCEVTEGEAGNTTKIIKGNVLTPTTVYKGGQVAVDAAGQISCVGCDCATGGETVISCPDASISPGLINTHDHITFTHNDPVPNADRFDDRQQWRVGQDGHASLDYKPSTNSTDLIRWGELRFLMSGTTSIVGSGGAPGWLRNLDNVANQEGLSHKAVNFDTFPLDDTNGGKRDGDCNYGNGATTAASIAGINAYEPHTAEGIDATARNEFLCQSSETYDTTAPGVSNNLLLAKTAMIHAIGLTAADYTAMAQAGTGLIWSPRSNISLYGDTARVTIAAAAGVEIALGTDWMPSGSMNMLRELACADSFNKTYLNAYFRDDQLWKMVTLNAASLTATDDAIGLLAKGRVADISIFAGNGKAPYRAVLEAQAKDVTLVMRAGKVLYGDDPIVSKLTGTDAVPTTCETLDVCSSSKRVCATGEIGKTLAALKTATSTLYPAFSCELPANEPTCVPSRPTAVASSSVFSGEVSAMDSDGDGIPDATDNCPKMFNPIRPMDQGKQPDADDDGVGDACDICPTTANRLDCQPATPYDHDHDGLPNSSDNCPEVANPDQADDDKDGKGNACDACPTEANPGSSGCPKSIYDIKSGAAPTGLVAHISNAIVTGRGSNGFYVQVKQDDPAYIANGPDNSGLFIYTNNAPPADIVAGKTVAVDGTITLFSGALELDQLVKITVDPAAALPAPAPIVVSYADVKTGGPRAAKLEAVLIQVPTATVTAVDAMYPEFTVTDGASNSLVIDDFFFASSPLPAVGQGYLRITGVLAFRQSMPKLEVRSAADLVLPPAIASFGPALSYARVGETTNAVTFPQPLTVTLNGVAEVDSKVKLTSNNGALTVADVIIPAGQTSVTVPVTATAEATDVTISAVLDLTTDVKTAHVRVLGAADLPTTVALTPKTADIHPGETLTFTATLNLPAATDQTVALAVDPVGAGTLTPASLTIPKNALSGTFTFKNALSTGTITLTATFGTSTDTATLNVKTGATHLVISQVYGAGGNAGPPEATFTTDFIELHNPTSAPISLKGLSLQYGSASNGNWAAFHALPDVAIPAGGYYLVAEGTAGTKGAALPTPDTTGTLTMGAAAGKVALANTIVALPSGTCGGGALVIDLVGYGTATCFEGTAATVAPSTTSSVARIAGGCTDTDDNKADFVVFTGPTFVPRNSMTTPLACN